MNILSYDLMHRKAQELKQFRFKVIIMVSYLVDNVASPGTFLKPRLGLRLKLKDAM